MDAIQRAIVEAQPEWLGAWKHYKGGLYIFESTAVIESTKEVVYVYRDFKCRRFVRPVAEWYEMVEHNGEMVQRFTPFAG